MNDKNLPAVEAMKNITLNTAVTMDDVVNIFVSRFENTLMDRQKVVRKELQVSQAASKLYHETRMKEMTDAIEAELKSETMFASFKVDAETSYYNNTKDKKCFAIRTKLKKFTSFETSKEENSVSFQAFVEYGADYLTKMAEYEAEQGKLKAELVSINNELQSVDRKARQVKGLIAERKLEAEGMQALLDDPTMQGMVQLPNLND